MAHPRADRRLTRLPLSGPWALAPGLNVLGLLLAAGLGYAVAQSFGGFPGAGRVDRGVGAYRDLLGQRAAPDLWASAGFTLWVSAASTLLATLLALMFIAWLDRPAGRGRRLATGLVHLNLAIPHVVWAVALLLVLSQSGLVARSTAALGIIDTPAEFPVLVRDQFGAGIIVHYATKEAPFLMLIGLALLRAQPRELGIVADTLGARGVRRVRLVVIPSVLPGLAAASALVFAFVFGSYEAPVVLGVSSPRMLSVLGLDLFSSPDLAQRPPAMALGVLMSVAVCTVAWIATRALVRKRT